LSDFGIDLFERTSSAMTNKLLSEKVDRDLKTVLEELISKKHCAESSVETVRLSYDALKDLLENLGYLNKLTSNNEQEHRYLLQAIWI
jgi:hypothetical protein